MRQWLCSISIVALLTSTSCAPVGPGTTGGSVIDAVADLDPTSKTETANDTDSNTVSPPSDPAPDGPLVVRGAVSGDGDYKLYDLGRVVPGQRWSITADGAPYGQSSYLLVLFDANYDLLQRDIVYKGAPLEHIVRAASGTLYLGVTPAYGRNGGDFTFTVYHEQAGSIPAPAPQVVWLNFAGGSNVAVHRRSGISFPAFSGDMVGSGYADQTETLKQTIVEAMREDYAQYNLVVVTSDDGPAPADPYATLHFGAYDERLLGLADSVDRYNQDRSQTAVIYVESFADFEVMRLTPQEMGQMIGNVASHELGHLLGLFHTQVPDDVMDTTGSAWDLAADQTFTRAELESNVFPMGYENSPARLAETIGYNPDAEAELNKPLLTAKAIRKAEIRLLARQAISCGCGTCLHLDE